MTRFATGDLRRTRLAGSGRRPPLPFNPDPLVIAHRGASRAVAEHTLPAYLAAIEAGADGLECDIRLTRDGHLVCVHDRTIDRTSNGSGVVSELELTGLQALDFRSWYPGDGGAPTASDYLLGVAPDRIAGPDSAVLTLETLLGVVADAGRPLRLLIETKHPTRYQGLVEKELVRLLSRFGWAGRTGMEPHFRPSRRPLPGTPGIGPVTVMSFAPVALRRVRLLAPDLPLVLLMDRRLPVRRDGYLPAGVGVAGPGLKVLKADPEYVARVHRRGHQVYCWTVDEQSDVAHIAGLGVDAIISNRPAEALGWLGGPRPTP